MRLHWRDSQMTPGKWLRSLGVILGMFLAVYLVAKPLLQSRFLVFPPRARQELTEADTGKSGA